MVLIDSTTTDCGQCDMLAYLTTLPLRDPLAGQPVTLDPRSWQREIHTGALVSIAGPSAPWKV